MKCPHVEARPEAPFGGPECAEEVCTWKWRVVTAPDSPVGTIEVDATTGAVVYGPNDGTDERLAIEAMVQREAERKKAVASVEALPVVKTYCKRVRAQKLGCMVYVEAGPSEPDCGASPKLESSCSLRV